MKDTAPSLKELWVKGDLFTKLVLVACALPVVWFLYSIRIWNLLNSEAGISLVGGAFALWFAYRLGVQVGMDRVYTRLQAEAEERRQRAEAALPPEERKKRLRQQIRDEVIFGLSTEERVMFAVPNPSDPKQIALEARVDSQVERLLSERWKG